MKRITVLLGACLALAAGVAGAQDKDAADALAERVVDPAGVIDIHAEALSPGDLEREHLDAGERRRNRAGNLAIQLFLLFVLTRRHPASPSSLIRRHCHKKQLHHK